MTINSTPSKTPVSTAQLILFLVGFTTNLIPAMVVYLKQYSTLELWQISFFNTVYFISSLLVAIPGYCAVHYYGHQRVSRIATLACVIGAISSGLCITYSLIQYLFISVFIWSLGVNLWGIIVCTYIMQFRSAPDYHLVTVKAFCADSLGAILCPLMFSAIFTGDSTSSMLSKMIFFLLLTGAFISAQQRFHHHAHSSIFPGSLPSMLLIKKTLQTTTLQSGLITTFLFIGLEFTIPMLISEYPIYLKTYSNSLFVSLYWGNLLLARLMAIKILRTTSTHVLAHYSILTSIAAIILALILPDYSQTLLCCIGFSNASLYPYIFSSMSKKLPTETHVLASCLLRMGLVGCGIIPSAMMLIGKYYGTTVTLTLLIAGYCLLLWTMQRNNHQVPLQWHYQSE